MSAFEPDWDDTIGKAERYGFILRLRDWFARLFG